MIDILNSLPMYLICGGIILVVALVCVVLWFVHTEQALPSAWIRKS